MRAALLLGAFVAALGGCASAPNPGAGVVTKREASYVRFLNLTAELTDGYVDKEVRNPGVEPGTLSSGTIVSQSKQRFSLGAAKVEAKPTPGKYLTIVAFGAEAKAVVGGPCLNPEAARVEFANFSPKPAKFKMSGKEYAVGPSASAFVDVPVGSYDVATGIGSPARVSLGAKEIWAVCLFDLKGKTVAKSFQVKGPMKATASGSSSAG